MHWPPCIGWASMRPSMASSIHAQGCIHFVLALAKSSTTTPYNLYIPPYYRCGFREWYILPCAHLRSGGFCVDGFSEYGLRAACKQTRSEAWLESGSTDGREH